MNQPSDTPRTDELTELIGSPSGESLGQRKTVSADFARTIERELNEAKKWKEEGPRILREQIRVADSAFNTLHATTAGLIQRAEAAEQKVMELREYLEDAVKCAREQNRGTSVALDQALSSSALIAAKWVPVEDVKPLLGYLQMYPNSTGDIIQDDFLAKHGDKFKTQ